MAKRLGPARPRAITWKGAGAWLIFSHVRQVNFSRTCWITFHWRGMTSSVSVMSSPSLESLVEPQHAQAVGPGTRTRSRGRCGGNGFGPGLAGRGRRTQRARPAGLGGGLLGRDLVFGGRRFAVFQLELHLIKQLAPALGAAAIALPPHLLDGELEKRTQGLGAGGMGRRPRGCGLGTRSLRLRVNAGGTFNGKEPFEAFQIVRQVVNRRRHDCE